MTVEVAVMNPAYWSTRVAQFAQLLRSAGEGNGPLTVGDPTGQPVDPDRVAAIVDPLYWSGAPRELEAVLLAAADSGDASTGRHTALPTGTAGAGSDSSERLTMTVEEAAAALGISRAFAYEAVGRNEIPHVRIGRRILIPRAALERMLGNAGTAQPEGSL